ncbi:MAG: hypothetical protein KBI41_08120 [Kiritimatiellae bacterium]|jgi:hypothetical protein|nr:hypothetical protein [Kiritimatiellia bacterium]MDD2348216.1 hypothetical protein [Kiritimatiellia bacterium]MDD3583913.1 hypothetical protein [Kiritimatiellia bacterium]HHU13661.1 hypothetical protein [Lentisphaerota bacterium]HON48176.1 hypothetical protein [Kiritimatiellia bacterium]
MRRIIFMIAALIAAGAAQGQISGGWFDLTVHDAVFGDGGSNLVSGTIHPLGVVPTMQEFREAEAAIIQADAVATQALAIAVASSNRAATAWHDVADLTSNGVWEIAFTMSALRGVGAADDIASETVGFSVEDTADGRQCHIIQWFAEVPPQMPDFVATHTTNLLENGFEEITVTNTFPNQIGTPADYGKTGGACYRVTATVPLSWGQCFFKLLATGFVIRGNALPIVRGVAGGAHHDIVALDAVGLTNVVLNIRGGFAVDTNNPLVIMMMEP